MIPKNAQVKIKSTGQLGRIDSFVKAVDKYLVFLDSGIAKLEPENNIVVLDDKSE